MNEAQHRDERETHGAGQIPLLSPPPPLPDPEQGALSSGGARRPGPFNFLASQSSEPSGRPTGGCTGTEDGAACGPAYVPGKPLTEYASNIGDACAS